MLEVWKWNIVTSVNQWDASKFDVKSGLAFQVFVIVRAEAEMVLCRVVIDISAQ